MKKNNKKVKVPFFAHLLTGQEMKKVAAGGAATSPAKDVAHTDKWPSDGDDSTPINDHID